MIPAGWYLIACRDGNAYAAKAASATAAWCDAMRRSEWGLSQPCYIVAATDAAPHCRTADRLAARP